MIWRFRKNEYSQSNTKHRNKREASIDSLDEGEVRSRGLVIFVRLVVEEYEFDEVVYITKGPFEDRGREGKRGFCVFSRNERF